MRNDTTFLTTDLAAIGVNELSNDELLQTGGTKSWLGYLIGYTLGLAAAGGAACAEAGGTIPVCGA